MKKEKTNSRSPWFWVPSLYLAEGVPYVIAMTVTGALYQEMGISNSAITLYTSWLYLPWVIKPLWSPVVEIFKTKRWWIFVMQFIIGISMASVAFTIPLPNFFQITLAIFWLMAFSSSTHDMAADGYYMMGLTQHQQAWYVGVRSTFYRFSMIAGMGLLPMLVGLIQSNTGLPTQKISVNASKKIEQIQKIAPIESLEIKALDGPVRIITYPENLSIPIRNLTSGEVNQILKKNKDWNIAQGHKYDFEKQKQIADEEPSWWHRNIVVPLGKTLKYLFNVEEQESKPSDIKGNIGIFYIYLSSAPESDDKIVVTLERDEGDKNISLVEGERFEFTDQNWNKPLGVVIQLDPKLNDSADAIFIARAGNVPLSWSITFFIVAILFVIFAIYHRFILPYPSEDVTRKSENLKSFFQDFLKTFVLFFKKRHIGIAIAFLIIYRLAESQIVKLGPLFLLNSQENGGLGLTIGEWGFVYGTVGMLMLTVGGLFGGFLSAKYGLKKLIWLMVIAINLPDAVYIYLAHYQPDSYFLINLCIGIEQLGYGFGFTAYMLYMIYVAKGELKTAHFAITTGFMALGMMIPGMFSGWIQEMIGYENFFIWVLICAIPGFIIVKFLPLDPEFGKKRE